MQHTKDMRFIPVLIEIDDEIVSEGEVGLCVGDEGIVQERLFVPKDSQLDLTDVDPERIGCRIRNLEDAILYIAAYNPERIGRDS